MLPGVVIPGSFLLCLTLLGTGSAQQDAIHYSIIAPKAFRVSSVYNITATCYNVTSVVHVTLRLQSAEDGVLAEKEADLENGITKIVSLQIPDFVPEATYSLEAEGTGGLIFNDSHSVSVTRKTLSIFVQTDKAMYKPGQTVLFRAIVIHPDLKPFQGFMDIAVYDLVGNKIMQWTKQRNDTGVVTQKLALSDQTPLGDWQIVVNAGGNSFTKTFQVAEYVLPKFEVNVILPPYFLLNTNRRDLQSDLPITVMAKYTYGQPVKGRAIITIQVKPYYWDYGNYTKTMMDVQLMDGKADVTLAIEDLLALAPTQHGWRDSTITEDPWTVLAYRTILVVADVQETVTGISLSGNATVDCKAGKYQLQFLQFSPGNFKPGLLYTAFFQLSQMDGSAPDLSEITFPGGVYRTVTLQATFSYPQRFTPVYEHVPSIIQLFNISITPSGYMNFSLMIDNNVTNVYLQLSFYVDITNSTVYGYKSINPFKSRDNQGIQVSHDSQDGLLKAMQNANFKVKTTEEITKFQYEVLSKGNILLSDNVVGDASTEHSFSIWISKELAMKLAPSARVLVWFITSSGEIITDSIEVSVSDIFTNEVSLSFDRESTTPSQNVSLTVSAYQGSYVGLLAVDQSVLLLKQGNDITQDMVSEDLKGYDSVHIDHFGRQKRSKWWWPIFIDGSDSKSILDKAGLLFLTDGYVHTYQFPSIRFGVRPNGGAVEDFARMGVPGVPAAGGLAPQGGEAEQPSTKPRVNFPETWLWTDETAGPDGRVTISTSVPDTITSWVASAFAVSQVAGLGIATDKAKLTVFKHFFVSPNLPYSVIRGEEFALQVSVFNYMPTPLDVSVTLQESTYYKVQGVMTKLAQVESNDAVSVYFWIVPGSLGQIPIDIMAKSSVAGDAVKVMLLVKPEGVQQQYSTSTFIQLTSPESTYNNSLLVSLPPLGKLVPGSEFIEVTVIGDLMGPSIKGLDNLLQMPSGCGEQNMLTFAPDVCIVKYLSISEQLTEDLKSKALGFMNAGYQRELTYQRSDGSFSAFGNNDKSGSIWLSSMVIKSFHQAKDYIAVEDLKIAQTMQWIIDNQAENGSFAEPPLGKVIHTDMQGGSSVGLPLTAYVLIALIENQNNSKINSASVMESIALASSYLEEQVSSAASDPYALSIIGYALVRAHSSKVSNVLQMLEALAKVEAGTRHWEKPAAEAAEDATWSWRPPYSQARSVNIEMTSYVLLTYCQLKNLTMSLPIAKWIIAQRNANGGFSSTQDTVMALEALAEFASMIIGRSGERDLHVSIATDSVEHSFLRITGETSILFQSYELPSETTKVFVSATGKGSALVQLNVKYNTFETDDVSGIKLDVNTTQDGNKITIKSCSSWKKKEGSGMVVMEVNQLTGFEVSNLDDLKDLRNEIKRVESNNGKVVLYFDELTATETCIDVAADKVFQVSNVKDASVKVYPYYDPSGGRTMFYSAPQALRQNSPCAECPQCCAEGKASSPNKEPSTLNASSPLKKPSALVVITLFIYCQLHMLPM